MSGLLADTHTIIWYLQDAPQLSASARDAIEEMLRKGHPLFIASITLVEIIYLVEKARLPDAALDILNETLDEPRPPLVVVPLTRKVVERLHEVPRDMVPDMPDRIIEATALHLGCPLVTRDRQIQHADVETV